MPIVVNTPALSPDLTCSPWATTGDLCDPCSTATIDAPLLLRCLAAASDVLFMLSGRQYTGECDDVVRPCAKPVAADHGRPIRAGQWPWGAGVGWSSGPWQGATSAWGFCLCNRTERAGGYTVAEVPLPGYPVTGVSSVKVDGVELVAGVDYRVDDDRYLVRLPDPVSGESRGWPCHQRVDLPDTEPGTWCVDEETEILTARGWSRYHDLVPGEDVYVLDPQTRAGRFEPLSAVTVFLPRPRQMRSLETSSFSSLTTLDHRWPVWQNDNHDPRFQWRTTASLTVGSGIFRSAPRSDSPVEPKWSDSFVELVAWMWTEGSVSGPRSCIAQSERRHPQHVASIRRALGQTFPQGWTEQRRPDGMVYFRLRNWATRELSSALDDAKRPLPSWLGSLTTSQLTLFIDRCIDGDGHRHSGGTRYWYQLDEESIGRFQMACALAGIPTNTTQPRDFGHRFGRVPQTVALTSHPIAKPLDAVRVSTYRTATTKPRATDDLVTYDGPVWCPTTPSGTWLARRHGSVYFTGNSVAYSFGRLPPPSGVLAAAELGCQLALALTPAKAGECRLPKRVTSIARQGVSAVVLDPMAFLEKGKTGLYDVDLFLSAVNRNGLNRRARAWHPEMGQRSARRTDSPSL